jgi:cellulose 1,4-beta-cellobiosidase
MDSLKLLVVVLSLAFLVVLSKCDGNPFLGANYYVNPSYQKELDSSIATETDPVIKKTLQAMRTVGSAYWLDVKAKIRGNDTSSLQGILADAYSKKQLPVFIVYDLPNRDCHAKASNGEICCYYKSDKTCNYDQSGDCSQGIQEYQTQYIDQIAAVLKQFPNFPIVLIIEPDSLPNLATNQGDPHCGNTATTNAYKIGIPYAIKTLATACPSCTLYVDAAHGGWLGWQNNIQAFSQLIGQMNIQNYIRGFSTNVANYQPLGVQCPSTQWCLNNQHPGDPCCYDPCKLLSEWNPANNEQNYVLTVVQQFKQVMPGFSPKFIIDTGRNGVGNMRSDCANWCNIRGAGVGHFPTTNTTNPDVIDAYYWLKTPGESDGCTQTLPDGSQCVRYDSMCGSADSIGSRSGEPRAPVAGQWFDYQIKQLAANANFTGFA